MEDLNALSNEELKYRLTQFGFPNLPVTSTTRKVLIKKLRNHLENEKSKLRRDTSYATRYSSDEETPSDTEKSPSHKKRNAAYTRSTISSISQTANIRHSPSGRKNLSMPPPIVTNSSSRLNNSNSSNIYVSPLIQSEADEESDSNSTYSSRYSGLSLGISSRQSIGASTNASFNGDHHDSATASGLTNGIGTNNDYDSSPSCTKRLLSFRNISTAPPTTSTLHDSNRRFDNFSVPSYSTRFPSYTRDHSITYQAKPDKYYGTERTFSLRSMISSFFSRFNERYAVKQSLVPCLLLTALFVFFAAIVLAYLTMDPDLSAALDASAARYKICPSPAIGFSTNQPAVNCIEETELEASLDLLKIIIPELQKRIVFNRCNDASSVFAMSAKEVIEFLIKETSQSVLDTMHTLHNADYLIASNPQWRVTHYRDNSGSAVSKISMDEVVRLRPTQSNYYAISNPRLPTTCYLYTKLQLVFYIIGWIGVVALLVYAIVFSINYVRSHLQSRRERLHNMIESIKNVLMEKAYDPDTACTDAAAVVVNHLRDKVIPASERSQLESVWNAAIRFLEQHESRIQFSVMTRNGEDHRVMRWVDTTAPSQQNSIALTNCSSSAMTNGESNTSINSFTGQRGNVKKWQSPAFDKSNKIKDPPTECLKIRQMFEKYEVNNPNLKQIIQDAILEKVAHTSCKIYDIQLDKATCCVYVRCATSKDAGIVHDEVNGWWFDSRLVSIKFLRLDRYVSRFPNSSAGPTCLRPSNTRNSSMPIDDDRRNGNGKRLANDVYGDDGDEDEEDDDYYN